MVAPQLQLDGSSIGEREEGHVQTHFVADRPECGIWNRSLRAMYTAIAPAFWRGLDDITAYESERPSWKPTVTA